MKLQFSPFPAAWLPGRIARPESTQTTTLTRHCVSPFTIHYSQLRYNSELTAYGWGRPLVTRHLALVTALSQFTIQNSELIMPLTVTRE